jgi:phosphoribosyl-ATP pyrophosphohydrolase
MDFLSKLDDIIAERKESLPTDSYTTTLFQQGVDRICRKVGEEAGEVIVAAKNNDPKELTDEVSDLLFHLMVLLHNQGLSLTDVSANLEQRHQ